jgi:hypothetical protein
MLTNLKLISVDSLLLILFKNTLASIFDYPINVLLFVDDTKVFLVISLQHDCIKLKFNLKKLN